MPGRRIVWLLLAVTLLKLVLASVWGWTADIYQTSLQASAFLAGHDLFDPQNTGGGPAFFPLGHYLIAAACLMTSHFTGIPFSFLLKTPAIVADLGVALLLRTTLRGGERAAIAYMLNPVTFLLSVYHGQLHTVAMAAAVLAFWLLERNRFKLGALALGLAGSVRQHYAVLIVLFLKRSKVQRPMVLAVFGITFLLLNLSLLESHSPGRIFSPTWTYGSWGYTIPLVQGPRLLAMLGLNSVSAITDPINQFLQHYGASFYWLWALAFGLWTWRVKSQDPWKSSLLFLVGLYAISPGFGIQWLVWVVPFWLIVNRRQAFLYSILAGLFIAGSYWQAGLNGLYGVRSVTANLRLLHIGDLIGMFIVGFLGVLTWVYCVRVAWQLARPEIINATGQG